jgi:futalosine hydrolase
MILLACAVEAELGSWADRQGVETAITGVGPVEASCAIAFAVARRRYELVVNAGIAGAFEGAARIGEGVIVTDDTFELALEDGRPLVIPNGRSVADKARSDPRLVARLRAKGFAALHGVTVARVTSTEETAARLGRLGAQVESMEGFAVLRAAELAGVPAIELRGISNRVGSRSGSGWNFEAGVAGLQSVLLGLFDVIDAPNGATT